MRSGVVSDSACEVILRIRRGESEMKIVVVQVIAAEENSEGGQFCKKWADLMRKNMDLVKQKDTELTFRFPRWGCSGFDAFFFNYLHHLNDQSTFHAIAQAEKEGFDAAIITCFYDPMLRDIRQAVNIPVVSIGEASEILSLFMGAKFGVVSIGLEAVSQCEENIVKDGLQERAVRVRPIPETPDEQLEALTDAGHSFEAFTEVGRELIADGAEVLIAGCGLMSPGLRLATGHEKEYPNGLTDVDGAAIVDVLGVTVKLAEMLVSLKQAGSAWISRRGQYVPATPKAIELAQDVLEDKGRGYWDC
jgi:Asp/Glu/hydantoin racemase